MSGLDASRRDVLRGAGLGLLGLAGLSTAPAPVASHESLEASATDLIGPVQVPANSDAGFNYPYYLYVPESNRNEPAPILVEPNNTGTVSDDFEKHRTSARDLARGRNGSTRTFSEALTVPLLVPAFPRPRTEPVDGNHYVHALDETTMNLDGGELERIDLQLVSMVEHARELLRGVSYPVSDQIIMNGFSASGNFVNRFAALHPDLVRSVTAGGVNGTLLLPLERAEGHTLNFHVGVADLEAITGEPFDAESWRDVAQFIYMGGEDENDTIPYSDAWNDTQRQIALDVYGEHMQDDRMPYCERVYDEAGANAEFEIYDGIGHRMTLDVQQDVVAFHREHAALTNVSFAGTPAAGDTTVDVDVTAFDERDRFDLRVRSDERGDVTGTAATVETGGSAHATIELASPVEQGERIAALVVPTGATDPGEAVARVDRTIADTPSIRVVDQPTADDHTFTVEHAVSANYETSSPIHVYVFAESGDSGQMVGTFSPGVAGSATYELDPDELGTALEPGAAFHAELVDVDGDERLAAASFVVSEEDKEAASSAASVAFDVQPTAGRGQVTVDYAVDDAYDPAGVLTLQLGVGGDQTVLLDALEPGDAATETYPVEKIPAGAGDEIEARVVDEEPIARSRTVVVAETNGAVEIAFTERSTDDDADAAVEYRIDDAYQVRDAITLRRYTDGLPGADPGEALSLLSPGDSGTETITVGEDVAPDAVTVAIVDDDPLALARGGDSLGDDVRAEQTGDGDSATQSGTEATDTGTGTATDGNGPGFGVGSALASAGSAGYLLKRRLGDAPADSDGDTPSRSN